MNAENDNEQNISNYGNYSSAYFLNLLLSKTLISPIDTYVIPNILKE